MKKPTAIYSALLILGVALGAARPAGAVAVPNDSAREGTKVEISAEDVQELQQWIQNAKYSLENLKESMRILSTAEKLRLIESEFNRIVATSGQKSNELYVRYVLNRSLVVADIVGANPKPQQQESLLGLFDESISLALSLYVDDSAYLEAVAKNQEPSRELKHIAVFGREYVDMLLGYSQTFLDPAIEYKITRTALGFFGNDLNSPRNLDRAIFSAEIIKIQQLLTTFPAEPTGASSSIISDIRKLKYEYRELLVPKIAEKLKNENNRIQKTIADENARREKVAADAQARAQAEAQAAKDAAQAAQAVADKEKTDRIRSTESYKKCYSIVQQDGNVKSSSDANCLNVASWYKFDGDTNFDACYDYERLEKTPWDSLAFCVKSIANENGAYVSASARACVFYGTSRGSPNKREIAESCANVANWFHFANNESFEKCFKQMDNSALPVNSYRAVSKCVDILKDPATNLFSDDFNACFKASSAKGFGDQAKSLNDVEGFKRERDEAAFESCAHHARTFHFSQNSKFDACFSNELQEHGSVDSINRCVEFLK